MSHLINPWRTGKPIGSISLLGEVKISLNKVGLLFLVSENLRFIMGSNILPGYRTDHSTIVLEISLYGIKHGRGFCKCNDALLKSTDYIKLINTTIDQFSLQYDASDTISPPISAMES